MIRIVQWTTGNVGSQTLQAILRQPTLELVRCYAWGQENNGRDAGTLVGLDPIGIEATSDIDALLALEPDCVC